MNFQDIVDKNNKQLNVFKALKQFHNDILMANVKCREINSFTFTSCYKGTGVVSTETHNHYLSLRESLIAINAYELKDTLGKIKNIYNNDEIDQLLNSIEQSFKVIMEIRKINDSNGILGNYINCYDMLHNILSDLSKLNLLLNYTSIINKDLSKGIKDAPLKIRSNVNKITEESFNSIINPIQIIYTQLCMIANINESENPLEIIRIESGTLSININLDPGIGKVISEVLSRFHEFIVRHFTKQGTKMNIAESCDMLSKEINIIQAMNEAGIDTSEINPIAKETAGIIFKQANIFLAANPDVKINEKVLNRSEDVKKLLSEPKYLEASIDKKNQTIK